jgi:acyl-CoA thioesterase FadM
MTGDTHDPRHLFAPKGAFTRLTRVRSFEVGRGGAIGIGTILRYLEGIATEASAALGYDFSWYERAGSAWVVREMDVLVGTLPGIGVDLDLATWVVDCRRVQAQRDYAIRRRDTGRLVARASARWGYIDRVIGRPRPLQPELAAAIPALGHGMRPRRAWQPGAGEPPATQSAWELAAREYETDTQQHINNCVYGDWLSEGLHLALLSWPDGPAPSTVCPRAYRIEYVRPARAGAELRVATQVWARGRRGLLARQEIVDARDATLYLRARSEHLIALG